MLSPPKFRLEVPPLTNKAVVWIDNDMYEVNLVELVDWVEDNGRWIRPEKEGKGE